MNFVLFVLAFSLFFCVALVLVMCIDIPSSTTKSLKKVTFNDETFTHTVNTSTIRFTTMNSKVVERVDTTRMR